MKLAIVYHRPYYRAPDGGLWEAEGSFSRFVESMARFVDHVDLIVPERRQPFPGEAYRLRAENVTLWPLPFYDRLPLFYRALPAALGQLWRTLPGADLVCIRIPTPLGVYAYALSKLLRRPLFTIVVGDLDGVSESVKVDSLKRLAYKLYLGLESWLQARMVAWAPAFVNGQGLYAKYHRPNRDVLLTTTSTIGDADVIGREDTGLGTPGHAPIRLLTVSRIDPRKGLRFLPPALAMLVERGHDVRLTIVGPTVGTLGEEERERVLAAARAAGIADRIEFLGSRTLPQVLALARQHDLFVLPTLPGEGVPRVLLEAMASGLPIVVSNVAGVPTLVQHEVNGLLVPPSDPAALADAMERLIADHALRKRLIATGNRAARAHTADSHARKIALGLVKLAGIQLRRGGKSVQA
ncbi:MAG: glycosyltransferase family 4 protein [Chloroflexi bacterium]|nr:glycosyltransferase family 4 protein [Chloroflexota bacterium]